MHIPEFSTKLQKKVEELYVNSVEKKRQAEEKYREAEKILLNELGIATWKPKNEQISVRSYNEILRAARFDAEFFQPKYDEIISILSKFDCRPLIRIADIMKSIEPGSAAYQDEGVPFYRVSDISKEGLKDPDIFFTKRSTILKICRLIRICGKSLRGQYRLIQMTVKYLISSQAFGNKRMVRSSNSSMTKGTGRHADSVRNQRQMHRSAL